jgi:hypothetical protein
MWPLVMLSQSQPKLAEFHATLQERLGVMVPAEDPDYEDKGEAWPVWLPRDREAVLQPAGPLLRPSPRLEAEPETEHEA